MRSKKVSVIGMGYVGFPLACAIAKRGYDVHGFDLDESKIKKINDKISPVDDKFAEESIREINIKASSNPEILKNSEYSIICVPTPVDENKKPDYTPVIKATELLEQYLKRGQYVILESTVHPLFCEEIMLPILERNGLKAKKDFELAHCPERINPGDTKWNVSNIPRNVGALTKEGTKNVADFYRTFIDEQIYEMPSIRVAEATKIIENSWTDTVIAFTNEIAMGLDALGVDAEAALNGASNRPFGDFVRYYPGCGVGGHCIPVDPYYQIARAEKSGFEHLLLKTARKINEFMPEYTINKLNMGLAEIGMETNNAPIGLLGLTYKENVADIRESPSLEILHKLEKKGAKVLTFDPYVSMSTATLNEILEYCPGIILATKHKEFLNIKDWKNVKVIVDGRNCLDKDAIKSRNIIYKGIGRI